MPAHPAPRSSVAQGAKPLHRAAAPGARQAQLCSPGSQRARDTCCYVEPGGERHCAGAARGGGAPIVCTVIGSIAQKQMERRRDLPRAWPQEARRMTGTGSGMRSHSSRTWTRRVRRPSSCSAAAWCCGAMRRRCGGVSRTAARTGARPPGAPTCCPLFGGSTQQKCAAARRAARHDVHAGRLGRCELVLLQGGHQGRCKARVGLCERLAPQRCSPASITDACLT